MTAFRFFLVIVVFCAASVGWMILGGTIEYRTHDLSQRLSREVDALWGPTNVVQPAPTQLARVAWPLSAKTGHLLRRR